MPLFSHFSNCYIVFSLPAIAKQNPKKIHSTTKLLWAINQRFFFLCSLISLLLMFCFTFSFSVLHVIFFISFRLFLWLHYVLLSVISFSSMLSFTLFFLSFTCSFFVLFCFKSSIFLSLCSVFIFFHLSSLFLELVIGCNVLIKSWVLIYKCLMLELLFDNILD